MDFYSKKKSLGGSNQKDPNDYNLGKNKKLVVDFSQQEEEKQPRKKSNSPNPVKTNPNVIKQNNFFDNKLNR